MVYAEVETRLAEQMKAQSREHSDSTPRPAPAKPSESAPLKPTTRSAPPAAAVQRTGQRRRDHSAPTNAATSSEASKPASLSDPSVELRQKQEAPQKDGTKEPHLQREAGATTGSAPPQQGSVEAISTNKCSSVVGSIKTGKPIRPLSRASTKARGSAKGRNKRAALAK